MTHPEGLESLAALPSGIAAALANVAVLNARQESAESRAAAEWSVIAGLQQSILERHEKEVLTERRVIWNETAALLAATTPSDCGYWADQKTVPKVQWRFIHPRLQQAGGQDMMLSVVFQASALPGVLTAEQQVLFDACAGKEQPRKTMRRALEHVGLETGSWRRPSATRAEMAGAAAGILLDKATTISAGVYARAAGETEGSEVASGRMNRTDLEGPEVIRWHDYDRRQSLALVRENKESFEKSACRFTTRRSEKPLELTLPVMDYFITKHLNWEMDKFRAVDEIVKLALDCNPAQ